MSAGGAWSQLSKAQPAEVEVETSPVFDAIKNPTALLTEEERGALRDDLERLSRLRRETEADSATLRLA